MAPESYLNATTTAKEAPSSDSARSGLIGSLITAAIGAAVLLLIVGVIREG